MSSSTPFKHTVTEVEPQGASIGDEYYNPVTNELFKKLVHDGNSVSWVKTGVSANTVSGIPILRQTGSVLQVVTYNTGAVATGTTILPFDDTIPQITEGTEFMTLAITPTSATSILIIQVTLVTALSIADNSSVALFQDSNVNALAAVAAQPAANITIPQTFTYKMIAGTTSSTTFRVRAGGGAASTITINGTGGARRFGGVMASTIKITEIAA